MRASQPFEDLQKVHKRRKSRESFLETLESIIVAFVLAFIFRAFVVEAFVIPTGSMAPTLYGAHLEFKCSDCGYDFAVGGDSALQYDPTCPNCFLPQRLAGRPTAYAGDRILVLKFLYDFQPPQRWDVIVFHNPNQPDQNYIKRLVALPGETIELVRGDVTIDRKIVQKTDAAQEALWMLVHDTRYKPARPEWRPRWAADKEWQAREAGYVADKPPAAGATAWLTYQHRDPLGRLANIEDYYAYNSGSDSRRFGSEVCTDLCLRTQVTAGQAASAVVVEMRAYKDTFRFELTAEGNTQPSRVLLNGKPVAQASAGVLPVGRTVAVEAANVDHKLMLLVGGNRVTPIRSLETTPEGDVLYTPTPVTEEEQRAFEAGSGPADEPPSAEVRKAGGPHVPAAAVRIGVRGGTTKLGYLRLDRDVYYQNAQLGVGPGYGTQGNPFSLRPAEYFVLGDNSPNSLDCRLWTNAKEFPNSPPRPVVPERNLVGKAFFVYWPAAGMRYRIPLAPDATGFRLVH